MTSARIVLLMGVSGSGKTTVGQLLAQQLGWPFRDADTFHPPANIAKMSVGIPLTDADRAPWLAAIRDYLNQCLAAGVSAVITCSALKAAYRQTIITDPQHIRLVYLKGSRELLTKRLAARRGHFMKVNMLESQLDDLEEPSDALTVDVTPPPAAIVATIRTALAL